ncbi:STAS domain-containing protein [Streptomyces griseofuscus]|uniref:STAS domain-containing protein n=1 Tax=Streptomyces griseofuscus TaxID=146922 RepID=UPI00369B7692
MHRCLRHPRGRARQREGQPSASPRAGTLRPWSSAPTARPTTPLAGMEFCDSSGISALLAARSHALAAQADIALAAVPAHTLRVLGIIGLDQVFALHRDSDTATRP